MSYQFKGNAKKVHVKVMGVSDLDTNMEIKNILQNIVSVTGVEDKEIGEYIVTYPKAPLSREQHQTKR